MADRGGVRLGTGVEIGEVCQIAVGLLAAQGHGDASGETLADGGGYGGAVVSDEDIGQARGDPLLAAGQAPDEGPVAGIVFLDPGFLLDHLRAVESQPRLAGDDQLAA